MRKILISILLASAAASPAFAQDQDPHGRWHREQAQGNRSQAKEERAQAREQAHQERANGGGNLERMQQRPAPQFVAPEQVQREQHGGWDRPRFERATPAPQQVVVQQGEPMPRQSFDRPGRRNRDDGQARTRDDAAVPPREGFVQEGRWTRRDSGREAGDFRQSERPLPNVMRTRNPLIISNTPREGTQPPPRTDVRRSTVQWNTNWRYNDRYDWRRWREHHRSWFHVGIYYDPFGWGYRPYQIGWRLWPSYYSSRYWIEDPWYYRLPYAPPGYVWVRYWDDALLVDTWSGEVVDVIHDFFW